MTATIAWHPEYDNALIITVAGNPGMEEILAISEKESDLVVNAPGVVHTVYDVRAASGVPQNFIGNMSRIARLPAASHPNAGHNIIVGGSGLIITVLTIYSKVYRRLHMVATMEEADALLRELSAEE
jgi:hypothetical protein